MKTEKDRIFDKCRYEAISLISKIKNESPIEIEKQLLYDNLLYNSVQHIASMYFEFRTNECLQHEKERVQVEYKRLGLL